ncbi:MAG: glycosyltransferase family 2 protein [Polaromonas sp.]|nr:glycosyltransferase family 2 protein [Polaromonas sp.]
MIGVVIPAHNEQTLIAACVDSIHQAARCSQLQGEDVQIVVVLDHCHDLTGELARQHGALTLPINDQNVGMARAAGAELMVSQGARWLAFTDADSVVSPQWLSSQLALKCDAVCGTVSVSEWAGYGERMRRHFEATYTDADDHRHIHGANLGVNTAAYLLAGGFQPLRSSEDVALVARLIDVGASVAWSASPRVVTSARKTFRAPGGFGATLAAIEAQGSWVRPVASQ